MMSTQAVDIRETVTALRRDGVDAVLYAHAYAHAGARQVGALGYTRTGDALRIDVIYVTPHFRRRGVGRALLRHLRERYPGLVIVFNRAMATGGTIPFPTADMQLPDACVMPPARPAPSAPPQPWAPPEPPAPPAPGPGP